ncbi:MAG: protein translocase subunit SecF [Syntrophobacteraceae bacterium]|nr:protein translocase subunit SecF [Desulfobacteraceae bacterium]
MEFIRPNTNIDFVGFRYKAFALSGIVLLIGLAALFLRGGLNFGVDFAGGTAIQIKFKNATSPDDIRNALKDIVSQSAVQQIGSSGDNEYLIRADTTTSELKSFSHTVESELTKVYGEGNATVMRVEVVGPKVGEDLRQKALLAMYYALLLITIYVSGRFEFKWAVSLVMGGVLIGGLYFLEALGFNVIALNVAALIITIALCWLLQLPYALGALISLLHDILITVGIFALFDKEFTLEVLAALLTLAGFSLNDTIVVFDRIRENRHKDRKQSYSELINVAVNQTLSRTILTNGTVFFVVICLFLFGGTVIHDFAFAMLIGVFTGTFSSIYIASPILIFYEELKKRSKSGGRPSPA